ncbi:hypothetical protein [Microtetraspora malaysiensis]|uniref:Formate dehydrogenase accessory protein FdhE n=1 Tax=Microtetraspora malaysiensis TaxID=161358 RepID=A0ABW6T2P5_9ACTN
MGIALIDRACHPVGVSVPTCPRCSGKMTPLMYGLPTKAAREAAEAGELALAGCAVPVDAFEEGWRCLGCTYSFEATDRAEWLAALEQAIAGRPRCPQCGSPSHLLVYADAVEIFADDIARGRAVVADHAAPAGVNAEQQCPACGHVWQPR